MREMAINKKTVSYYRWTIKSLLPYQRSQLTFWFKEWIPRHTYLAVLLWQTNNWILL